MKAVGIILGKSEAGGFVYVRYWEHQSLHEATHNAGHRAEIDRRAEDEGVGIPDLFKNGCQAVLHGTFPVTLSFVNSR